MVKGKALMQTVRTHPERAGHARAGFTLVELLIVILVIGVLLTVVITGIRGVSQLGRDRASTVTARNLGLAVRQFEQQFSFLPPLVHDGGPMTATLPIGPDGATFAESPVDRSLLNPLPAAYSGRSGDLFLRGYATQQVRHVFSTSGPWAGTQGLADQRYSKFSLPYYLVGVLGLDVDGVEGPGFRTPRASGPFGLGSEAQEFAAFYDAGGSSSLRLEGDYIDTLEYGESDRPASVPADLASATSRDAQALVDSNGRAFRYYRWTPGNPDAGRGVPEIADVTDQNIPSVLLDVGLAIEAYGQSQGNQPVTADPTDGDTRLRASEWAIVGAGADGLFGTEDPQVLIEAFGVSSTADVAELRQRAREDNVVEVGG